MTDTKTLGQRRYPTVFPMFQMREGGRVVVMWVEDKDENNKVRIAAEEHVHYLWDEQTGRTSAYVCLGDSGQHCPICDASDALGTVRGVKNTIFKHRFHLMQGIVFKSSVDIGVELPAIVGFRIPHKVFQDNILNRLYDSSPASIADKTFVSVDNGYQAYAYELIRNSAAIKGFFNSSGFLTDKVKVLPEHFVNMVKENSLNLTEYGFRKASFDKLQKLLDDTVKHEGIKIP